ncbi:hypothetical protein CDO73_05420 [Saccharibacillus sp. O23]|nr:hypothetical protein CDO73_05420 [Saccharibacillus sp. O23]
MEIGFPSGRRSLRIKPIMHKRSEELVIFKYKILWYGNQPMDTGKGVGLKPNEKRGPCEFETSAKAWYIFLQEKQNISSYLFVSMAFQTREVPLA